MRVEGRAARFVARAAAYAAATRFCLVAAALLLPLGGALAALTHSLRGREGWERDVPDWGGWQSHLPEWWDWHAAAEWGHVVGLTLMGVAVLSVLIAGWTWAQSRRFARIIQAASRTPREMRMTHRMPSSGPRPTSTGKPPASLPPTPSRPAPGGPPQRTIRPPDGPPPTGARPPATPRPAGVAQPPDASRPPSGSTATGKPRPPRDAGPRG